MALHVVTLILQLLTVIFRLPEIFDTMVAINITTAFVSFHS